MPRTVVIDIEARFDDNVTPEAKATAVSVKKIGTEAKKSGESLDSLGKKKAKPSVDAVDRATKKLQRIDKQLTKINRATAKTVVDAVDKATEKIKKVKIKAKQFASQQIVGKLDVDDSLYDRKITKAEIRAARLKAMKPVVLLNAIDKATAVVGKALSKARSFAGRTFSAMVKLKDSGAVTTLKKVTGSLEGMTRKTWSVAVKIKDIFTKPLSALKNSLFNIRTLIAGIASAWAAIKFVKEPIALADAYSSAQIGFSTILGDSGGQQMMNNLDEFAKKTPFNTSNVIANAQKMMAMGWDTDTLLNDMEVLGNAAAATGKLDEGLEQIVRAMAQIKTKGRLSTEELNQLAEAGIAAKAMLAENLGYGTGDAGIAKMTEDLEDGAIASDVAIQALLKGMQKYDGMMDSMANETAEGLASQLKDTFEINLLRKWGQGLQDGAKRGFGTVLDLLNESEDALSRLGDMLYEIGHKASNWVADKLQGAVENIKEVTGSYEFQEAGLGEKISMLWRGVVANPLKEWWDNGGQKKTAETAEKIGKGMGEMLTKGLLALLGVTDILKEGGLDENGGASVAQSFAQGFVDAFDVSAITEKLKEAISNVWGVLPWWAKTLLIGYGGSKLAIGGANLVSAIGSLGSGLLKGIGSFSIAESALPHLTSSGSGLLGFLGKAGVKLGASTTGGALLAGAGGVAGGAAALYSAGSGLFDLVDAIKYKKAGNMTESKANLASGMTAMGGVGAGAVAGAAIGSVVPVIGTAIGALLGAGIGGIAGLVGGKKWGNKIRADALKTQNEELKAALSNADLSAEEKSAAMQKAIWEDLQEHMGDIKLSIAECERLADQIVWGDAIVSFDKFNAAVTGVEASLQSLNAATQTTDRWLWKAGLGVKFNADEIDSIKASFDDYINSAKSYVENKHYEFTAAVSLLVDPESEGGRNIIDSGNAYFGNLTEQLDSAGKELGDALTQALADGIIDADESKAIIAAQQKIASITKKINAAELEAELQLAEVKFGGGKLSMESFDNFMATMQTTIDERMAAADEAYKVAVTGLQLQLADDPNMTDEEYKQQLTALTEGYETQIDAIKAQVQRVELDIIDDAYGAELGENSRVKLEQALNKSLSEGINPKDWTVEEARRFLGVESLEEQTALAIGTMLGGVADQLGQLSPDDLTIDGEVQFNIVGTVQAQNQIEILTSDFGIDTQQAETIVYQLSAIKDIQGKVDYLATEFGINETEAATILWKLTGDKYILNQLALSPANFGVQREYSETVKVNITANLGKVTNNIPSLRFGGNPIIDQTVTAQKKARGGIVGYPNGGMVQGGSQLITVAEEGTPEMIIPLGKHRRDRALELFQKTGELLGVTGFARGGRTDHGDEGIRFHGGGGSERVESSQSVNVDVGGVSVTIHVEAGSSENIVATIKAQAAEIAEEVAGVMADAFSAQFAATPARG